MFLHKYREMPVSPGPNNGSDTRVQGKEQDSQGQSQKSEIKGQVCCGSILEELLAQKGTMHPQLGTEMDTRQLPCLISPFLHDHSSSHFLSNPSAKTTGSIYKTYPESDYPSYHLPSCGCCYVASVVSDHV